MRNWGEVEKGSRDDSVEVNKWVVRVVYVDIIKYHMTNQLRLRYKLHNTNVPDEWVSLEEAITTISSGDKHCMEQM